MRPVRAITCALILIVAIAIPAAAQDQDGGPIKALVALVTEALATAVERAVIKAFAGYEALERTTVQAKASAATVAQAVTTAVTQDLTDLIRYIRAIIGTALALAALGAIGFIGGLLIGIQQVQKIGGAIVVIAGLIAAILATHNLGIGAGIGAFAIVGLIIPFAGTIIAVAAAEAVRRWLNLIGRGEGQHHAQSQE